MPSWPRPWLLLVLWEHTSCIGNTKMERKIRVSVKRRSSSILALVQWLLDCAPISSTKAKRENFSTGSPTCFSHRKDISKKCLRLSDTLCRRSLFVVFIGEELCKHWSTLYWMGGIAYHYNSSRLSPVRSSPSSSSSSYSHLSLLKTGTYSTLLPSSFCDLGVAIPSRF